MSKMTKKEEQKLRKAVEDILWMAIRYADGRHTYAPSTVRSSVKIFKEIWEDFTLREDISISAPKEEELGGISFREDYLYDLIELLKPKSNQE